MSAEPSHEHDSPIKTPQQLIMVVVMSFVVPVIGIMLLVLSPVPYVDASSAWGFRDKRNAAEQKKSDLQLQLVEVKF